MGVSNKWCITALFFTWLLDQKIQGKGTGLTSAEKETLQCWMPALEGITHLVTGDSQGPSLLGQGLGHESYVLRNTVLRQQGMCWAKHTQFLLPKSIDLITDLTYQRVREVRRGKGTRSVSLVGIFSQGRNRPVWGRSIFPAPGPLMKSDKVRAQTVRRRHWSRDSGALETRKGWIAIARERLSFMLLNLTLSVTPRVPWTQWLYFVVVVC